MQRILDILDVERPLLKNLKSGQDSLLAMPPAEDGIDGLILKREGYQGGQQRLEQDRANDALLRQLGG
jgi:hypothetical protein